MRCCPPWRGYGAREWLSEDQLASALLRVPLAARPPAILNRAYARELRARVLGLMHLTSLRRQQWLVWALAFAGAYWLETFLHELGHAIAGLALGGRPVLHSNYVSALDELPRAKMLIEKLAGSGASIAVGGLALLISRAAKVGHWNARLWLA